MLDEDSLELTKECEQDLKKVVNAETVEWFKAKYGRRGKTRIDASTSAR